MAAVRHQNSAATAGRFTEQLRSFKQSPQLFMLNSLLDVLENKGAHARKFIVAADCGRQVFSLDLLEKATTGLRNVKVDDEAEDENNN